MSYQPGAIYHATINSNNNRGTVQYLPQNPTGRPWMLLPNGTTRHQPIFIADTDVTGITANDGPLQLARPNELVVDLDNAAHLAALAEAIGADDETHAWRALRGARARLRSEPGKPAEPDQFGAAATDSDGTRWHAGEPATGRTARFGARRIWRDETGKARLWWQLDIPFDGIG